MNWQNAAEAYYEAYHEAGDHARIAGERGAREGMAYVWGWQDARGESDSEVGLAFGYVRGLEVLAFETGQSFHLGPVADSFRAFMAAHHGGTIPMSLEVES